MAVIWPVCSFHSASYCTSSPIVRESLPSERHFLCTKTSTEPSAGTMIPDPLLPTHFITVPVGIPCAQQLAFEVVCKAKLFELEPKSFARVYLGIFDYIAIYLIIFGYIWCCLGSGEGLGRANQISDLLSSSGQPPPAQRTSN